MNANAVRAERRIIIAAAAICAFFLICCVPLQAKNLKVGVWNAPPYVSVDDKGGIDGMSVQIWKNIAADAGVKYEIAVYENITEIIEAIATGSLDASIGPQVATAQRAEKVLFSQPYYSSGVGIMVPARTPTMWERIRPFLTTALLTIIFSLLLMLLVVGYLLWLFERGNNPAGFPKHWLQGVGSGMWLALSALTSVGFGDVVPKTRGGRIVCGIWMVLSMAIATLITAGLASMLTTALTAEYVNAQGIVSAEQIRGKTVAVLEGMNVDQIVHHFGGKVVYRERLHDMIDGLLAGRYDAVSSDRVSLLYYLQNHPNNKVRVPSLTLSQENLAFAFSFRDTKLFNRFNVILLRLQEAGTIDMISDSWINSVRIKDEDSNIKPSTLYNGSPKFAK
ncbi:MAG: transporter substrate-binding domain-containing protein [Candidatus Xenobiia bacterium LiM19]